MKLDFYCTKWGFPDEPIDHFCKRVIAAGYDGIEVNIRADREAAEQTAGAARNAGLRFIAQLAVPAAKSYEQHMQEYVPHLRMLAELEPDCINSHTGRDWYSPEQNQAFIDAAAAVADQTGIRVLHETHRGRFSLSAYNTYTYLLKNPDLRLVADFSHWCAVSESMLEEQDLLVNAAIERADHIHCRVGYRIGPQVNDPRAPEWKAELDRHTGWWGKIIAKHRAAGAERIGLTPEFGPWPYMVEQPYTRQPIADQWAINLFMKDYVKAAFSIC
jgi:sugar phosphate isomerase/epimerase